MREILKVTFVILFIGLVFSPSWMSISAATLGMVISLIGYVSTKNESGSNISRQQRKENNND